jgi:hypothetical protein
MKNTANIHASSGIRTRGHCVAGYYVMCVVVLNAWVRLIGVNCVRFFIWTRRGSRCNVLDCKNVNVSVGVDSSSFTPWWRIGNRGIAALLTSVADGGDHLDAPSALPPEETTLDRRLGGPQNPAWTYGENKNLFPLPGIEPWLLGRPAHSLVSIPTEPSRLTLRFFQMKELRYSWTLDIP